MERMQEIVDRTKELGEMILEDPRLADLLELEFLEHMFRLLNSDRYPLQAYAAEFFTPVINFSRNKEDVDYVAKLITPLVLDLICSSIPFVQLEALWLLRILVSKIPQSSVEQALTTVTSIILEDSDSVFFTALHAAAETLFVVCRVHPKLPQDKLSLAVLALMKLVESDEFLLYTPGCRGLACLCDGREEMVVEDKDFTRLISRLVDLLTAKQRAMVTCGLLSLGSIVRWGSDDVILAIGPQLISKLADVVQNCELADVVKEARWALSNAMCAIETVRSPEAFELRRLDRFPDVLYRELVETLRQDEPTLALGQGMI